MLIVFSPIFVAYLKIICGYDFVVPLAACDRQAIVLFLSEKGTTKKCCGPA